MNPFLTLLSALGLVSSGEVRHVADTGSDADDGERATPYKTIGRALQDAAALPPGQRLRVRISGTTPFVESLSIPSNVTLEGPAEIRAANPGPAVRIVGTDASPVRDVELVDLKVQGQAPYVGDGGAVLIHDADGVTLERCELHDSVAARGGGLAVIEALNVRVKRCLFHDNTAGTPAHTLAGAGMGVSMSFPTAGGHGGGVFVRDSDAEIVSCDITENHAILLGGGVAVTNDQRVAAKVDIVDCEVTFNQVSHDVAGLLIGSKPRRPDMGDPVGDAFVRAPFAAEKQKLLPLLHGMNFESGLGGGIGVRAATSATRVVRCKVGVTRAGKAAGNLARRGGGIAVFTGASPAIEDSEIAYNLAGGDGGGISIDLFDPVLPPGTGNTHGITEIPVIPRAPIGISRNALHHNQAVEDGGGLYATGAARVIIKGGTVSGNRAGENGGGLRATYAAELYAEAVAIRNNRANVIRASGTEREGGGGVAARNAHVHLQDCVLDGNASDGFAGGAVYFVSCWEGGFAFALGLIPMVVQNERGAFDQIMEAAFGFHTRVLRVINCRGTDNVASGGSGAGGFLYAVRAPSVGGAEPMWVVVDGAATAIGPNTSEYTTAAARKRGNIVIELSGTPEDRVFVSGDVPAAGIAASVPTPTERALQLLVDGTAAHDRSYPTWTGTELAHGAPRPTVTAITPALAATKGGTRLRLAGTGFEAGAAVSVGGVRAVAVSSSATELVVDSPKLPAGPADVVVTAPWGPKNQLPAAVRVLPPPTIVAPVRPGGAPGDRITLRGSGFVPGATVQLVAGATTTEAVVSDHPDEERLTFVVPDRPGADPVLVRVTLPTGDNDFREFTYAP